jgi:hypothetical protein
MTTWYKYGYSLGRDNPRTIDGKHIVFHNGREVDIESANVEFGDERMLTFDQFKKIVDGTVGITNIKGEFRDDERNRLVSLLDWMSFNKVKAYRNLWVKGNDLVSAPTLVDEYLQLDTKLI